MVAILWLFRQASPARVNRGFRVAQSVSAAAMSLGHGMQDAAKTMGVVVLALVVGGYHTGDRASRSGCSSLTAAALAAGTYAGGWRIMRTLGRRIIQLDPPHGFAAETTASSVLYVAAIGFGAPISTTHTITSAIMGVGRHQAALRGALGRGRQHRRRLGPHDPGAGRVAGARLRRPPRLFRMWLDPRPPANREMITFSDRSAGHGR